jgi:Na+-driven multidrug efflux pump
VRDAMSARRYRRRLAYDAEPFSVEGQDLDRLSYRSISLLYLPLALSWLLMLLEAPLINAFLARGSDAELSLAAYGVANSIILVVEAPIVMMLELSIALSKSLAAFRAIRRFYLMTGLAVTALGVGLFYTPLCQLLLCRVMSIPPAIASATAPALQILTWWPFPIGWRRIYQGILIQDGRTRIIGIATTVRLVVLSAVVSLGQSFDLLPGATLGAVAMVAAVVVETAVIHWATLSSIRPRLALEPKNVDPPTLRYLWVFYLPLAITTVLRQGIRPLVSAGIAVAPMAEPSLAAWPVAFSLTSIFWGPTMGLQQVTIALAEDRISWERVTRFVLSVGFILSGSLAAIAFTPLLTIVLRDLFGLSAQLAELATPATRVMVLLPLGYTFHALFTGLLVRQARTGAVRTAKAVNLCVVAFSLFVGLRVAGLWGAGLGALSLTAGTLVEAVWLYWRGKSAQRLLVDRPSADAVA